MPYLDHQLDKHKLFFHIAEVKHVLNSAEKKLWFKFGFWNISSPIDPTTYVQKSNIPLLNCLCLRFVLIETVERSLCVLKMNFAESWWRICPDRQDLISSPFGGSVGKTSMALGEKTLPKRWGIQTSWKKWGPNIPRIVHFTDAVAMFGLLISVLKRTPQRLVAKVGALWLQPADS